MSWLQSLDQVAMTIRAYRKQIEDLCDKELTKAHRQLQNGDDPAQVLSKVCSCPTNKLLHHPACKCVKQVLKVVLRFYKWTRIVWQFLRVLKLFNKRRDI